MSALAHTTECGLPGVTTIPYGVHLCHFYVALPTSPPRSCPTSSPA